MENLRGIKFFGHIFVMELTEMSPSEQNRTLHGARGSITASENQRDEEKGDAALFFSVLCFWALRLESFIRESKFGFISMRGASSLPFPCKQKGGARQIASHAASFTRKLLYLQEYRAIFCLFSEFPTPECTSRNIRFCGTEAQYVVFFFRETVPLRDVFVVTLFTCK